MAMHDADEAHRELHTLRADRIYPMAAPEQDSRFTYGLLFDAVKLLEKHGYPRPTKGPDLVALQEALFGFLYALPMDTPLIARPEGTR
jgi:hypothetical protein